MEHEEGREKKRKKHAIKIPSSLGLFIVDSSCFFVSGPEVQREREREGRGRGRRRDKRQNSKRLHLQIKTEEEKQLED